MINRTPKQLLDEIIVVDDFSDKMDMRDFLDNQFELVQVRIVKIRTDERIGLVRARLLGAKHARVNISIILFVCKTCGLIN